jgi:hypothetical protein
MMNRMHEGIEYPTEWGEMKTLSNEWRDEQ